jgi:hypothetical protein
LFRPGQVILTVLRVALIGLQGLLGCIEFKAFARVLLQTLSQVLGQTFSLAPGDLLLIIVKALGPKQMPISMIGPPVGQLASSKVHGLFLAQLIYNTIVLLLTRQYFRGLQEGKSRETVLAR